MIQFSLSEKEETQAREFMDKHRHPDVYKGTIGGHISFLFTPTAVGDSITIRCAICGEELDITDYEAW